VTTITGLRVSLYLVSNQCAAIITNQRVSTHTHTCISEENLLFSHEAEALGLDRDEEFLSEDLF